MSEILRPKNIDYGFIKPEPKINKPKDIDYGFLENQNVTEKQQAGAATYAAALGTEIAIAESVKMAATAVGGPLGYVIGGLAGGAFGSLAAQKITNPNDISYGRLLADSFINLIPGSKITKGAKTVKDVVARTAGTGAAIGAGGVTVEKAIDEERLPTLDELQNAGLTGGVLGGGLGYTGAKFNKVYTKIGGLTVKQIDEVLDPNTPKDKIQSVLQDVKPEEIKDLVGKLINLRKNYATEWQKKNVDDAIQTLKINYVDDKLLALQLQQESAGKQFINKKGLFKASSDEVDYYQESLLREALTSRQLEGYTNFYKETNDIAIDIGAKINRSSEDINRDVKEYLRAKHAIKYNKENAYSFGKSQNIYKEVKEEFIDPKTGKTKTKKVKEYIPQDGAAGISTKDAQKFIDDFEKADLHNTYKPLIQRRKHLSDEILNTARKGGFVDEITFKKLREKYPDYVPLNRILPDDLNDYNTSVFMGEVSQTGIREAKGSKAELQDLDQNLMDNLATMVIKANTNIANQKFLKMVESPENEGVGQAILKTTKDGSYRFDGISPVDSKDTALSIFEDGKKYVLKFKDPELAYAFKGYPRNEMSQPVKLAYTVFRWYNSLRGQLLTRYNIIEFPFVNKIRDMQETFINNLTRVGLKKSFEGVSPAQIKKSSMNVIARKNLNLKPRNAEEEKLYNLHEEFKKSGGSTGGLGLYSRDDIRREVEDIAKDQYKGNFKRYAQKFNRFIDKYNEIFEDSSRFTAFRLAKEKGYTTKQAAVSARNASFDPLKTGRYGAGLRATFLFANPAIQGTRILYRGLLRNPKKFGLLMGSLYGINSVLHFFNSSVDENYREKLQTQTGGNYILNKNLVVVYGKNEDGTLNYVNMPVSYPVIPLKVAADVAARASFGDVNLEETPGAVSDILEETVSAYNPTGGSPIPTPLRPFWELAMNEDGLGRPIRPELLGQNIMHSSDNVFDFTANTYGGELAMSLADTLRINYGQDTSPENIMYLYELATGGPGRSIEQIATVVSKLYKGEKLEKRDLPLVRRFIGESAENKVELRNKETLNILERIRKDAGSDSAINRRIGRTISKKVLEAPLQERMNVLTQELTKNSDKINKNVLDKIKDELENDALGITNTEKRIKSLPIKFRAKFIIEELKRQDLKDIDSYLNNLKRKKILTKETYKELLKDPEFRRLFLVQ